jgi:hypothetical protein
VLSAVALEGASADLDFGRGDVVRVQQSGQGAGVDGLTFEFRPWGGVQAVQAGEDVSDGSRRSI